MFVAASGSGSVIGRDPLPPRAVSTSQLPQQKTMLIQQPPPPIVTTLPLSRTAANAQQRQLQQSFNPLVHYSPSSTGNLYTNHEQLVDSRIMKTSTNLGDVKASSMGWVSYLSSCYYYSFVATRCNETESSARYSSTWRARDAVLIYVIRDLKWCFFFIRLYFKKRKRKKKTLWLWFI